MIRVVIAVIIIVLCSQVVATNSFAQRSGVKMSPTGGMCPKGTCAKSGGQFAKNIKNCSPVNCRLGGPR